jgi:hypothetical protein
VWCGGLAEKRPNPWQSIASPSSATRVPLAAVARCGHQPRRGRHIARIFRKVIRWRIACRPRENVPVQGAAAGRLARCGEGRLQSKPPVSCGPRQDNARVHAFVQPLQLLATRAALLLIRAANNQAHRIFQAGQIPNPLHKPRQALSILLKN